MGDGKEGERQPLLKNDNVTYSSQAGVAAASSQSKVNTVPQIGLDELPPLYPSGNQSSMPMITCRVCQAMIDISGKKHWYIITCGQCNETTVRHGRGCNERDFKAEHRDQKYHGV